MEMQQSSLKGKISFHAILRVETGLHIGVANDFTPIGAVDAPFVRDPFSKQPVIPGSSLKGKLRTLLAKSYADEYVPGIDNDIDSVQRLFGAAKGSAVRPARLQFYDLRMTEESLKKFSGMELDTYIGEIKFENFISRFTGTAEHPRQIERVPAGAEFDFRLVYNIENSNEVMADMEILADGLKMLQMDYLGSAGTRGYGRISLAGFHAELITVRKEKDNSLNLSRIENMLEGA